MSQAAKRFNILLIESDDDVASIIARVTSSVFPEAVIDRISVIEELISYIKEMKLFPRLIMLTSYRRNSDDADVDLRQLIENPLVHPRPILLMEYSSREKDIEYYYRQGITAVHDKPETYSSWKLLIEHIRNFWYLHARLPLH